MDRLSHFFSKIGDAYARDIVDQGKQPAFVMFIAFLLTFATVRFITYSIRDGKHTRLFRNMSTSGGTHLHHLVPGIILVLLSGWIAIGFPHFVHPVFLALLFGVGAALTLDEFALWFHLADVYWSHQGRQSIDAVVIAATLIGIGVVGGGIWADLGRAIRFLFVGS